MAKNNREIEFKWSWKTFFIVLLIIFLFAMSYSYTLLEDEYKNYQQEVQNNLHELELNITRTASELDSKYDCYEKGSVYCYNEPRITITDSCQKGYELRCVTEDFDSQLKDIQNNLKNICGEGNRAYCFRDDYNVGGCLGNERVVCQK